MISSQYWKSWKSWQIHRSLKNSCGNPEGSHPNTENLENLENPEESWRILKNAFWRMAEEDGARLGGRIDRNQLEGSVALSNAIHLGLSCFCFLFVSSLVDSFIGWFIDWFIGSLVHSFIYLYSIFHHLLFITCPLSLNSLTSSIRSLLHLSSHVLYNYSSSLNYPSLTIHP